jgi:hypothetical protein
VKSRANRVLTILFMVLCAINFGYLLLGFLSIPGYYQRTTTLTIQLYEMPGANFPTNTNIAQSAAEHGLTLAQFAVEQIVFHCAFVLLCIGVAAMIILRARWNWFAWYSAFFLIFMAGFAFYAETYVAHLLPLWVSESGAVFWPLILLYFYLFPNGRAVPRKSLWGIGPFLALHFVVLISGFLSLFPEFSFISPFMENVVAPAQGIVFFAFLIVLASQVYRYRRISARVEQQQSKWFLLGLAFSIGLSLISESFGDKNPYRGEVGLLIFMFVPVSVGIAILRYRLWDIDLIIRRALQYTLLTSSLALIYFGGVVLLQAFFSGITGQPDSPLITVISTLVIAALFNPLRRRIQDFIDRRFYRRKYDAEQAINVFMQIARDVIDQDRLTGALLGVVEETMQPERASLWLPGPKSGVIPRQILKNPDIAI